MGARMHLQWINLSFLERMSRSRDVPKSIRCDANTMHFTCMWCVTECWSYMKTRGINCCGSIDLNVWRKLGNPIIMQFSLQHAPMQNFNIEFNIEVFNRLQREIFPKKKRKRNYGFVRHRVYKIMLISSTSN